MAYLIEAVIYIFLGSYEYHPKLIRHDAYYDSHMGAITSNLITVPTLALLISIFQLNWIWIIGFTGLLAWIEWLFVKLEIYQLHWWRFEYTIIGLLLYFPLVKVLSRRMIKPMKGRLLTIYVFLCLGPISGTVHFLPFMLFMSRVYRPGWFEDPSYDTSAFGVVYYFCACLVIAMLAEARWKHRWLKYVCLEIVLVAVTVTLTKTGILHSQVWWDPWFYVSFPLIILKIAEAISRRLSVGLTGYQEKK